MNRQAQVAPTKDILLEKILYSGEDSLDTIIDDAIQNHHFSMVYQPLINFQNSRLIGFEALVRCLSPKYGFIPPDLFIPHAEQNGRILEVGDWIFSLVLNDFRNMLDNGLPNITMSLNISPVQILEGDLFERIMSLLDKLALSPSSLKLELTETALVKNTDMINKTLDAFQREGVKIWVDDFGTGFSSLSLLRQFNIDGLKIDRSFIEGIVDNNNDFTLCSAVIAMAQRLGMTTIAEGIETEEQFQVVHQLGCDVAQGYLLGKPESLHRTFEKYGNIKARKEV